jgi:hypothetical protein
VALVILTACMIYPGVTMLWQGLYPFIAGEYFNLVGETGVWMALVQKIGMPPIVALGLKSLVGAAWVAGVLGLWAGDGRAYPLVLLAAVLSLLSPGGPMVMGVIGLVCLIFFRESEDTIPA